MKVEFFAPVKDKYTGNIMWKPAQPMRGGFFPRTHPCYGSPEPMIVGRNPATTNDSPLDQFRALGYWASCFPEGDGITFNAPDNKTSAEMVEDIKSCFGWDVTVKRA